MNVWERKREWKIVKNWMSVAIIDSNPTLGSSLHIKKEDPPDPRVSTVTPASISFL